MCSLHIQVRLDNANTYPHAPRAANAFGFADRSANESIRPPNEKRRVAVKFSSILTAQEAAELNPGEVEVVRAGFMDFPFRLRETFRRIFKDADGSSPD